MPNVISRNSIGWVDGQGRHSRFTYFVSWDTLVNEGTLNQSLVPAMEALTNAGIFGGMGASFTPGIPGTYGVNNEYASIVDKAILTYVSAAGTLSRFAIPAPLGTLFLADKMTIDPANAAIVAFNAILLNAGGHPYFMCQRDGSAFSTFAGGLRTRRKNRTRISIFTRNPQDTGPAE